MTNEETVSALARAVHASDAGRRVGWARAYSAEASKDELSRDVNMLRMERDVMRRAASFLYGFFRRYLEMRGDTHVASQALARWSQQVGAVLDSEVTKAGAEAAGGVVQADAAHAAKRDAERAEKKKTSNQWDRAWKRGREDAVRLLAKRYGFPNEAALLNYLEQWRGRDDPD